MTAITVPRDKRRHDLLVLLILSTVLGVLLVVMSLPFLLMSFMAFDAGETPAAWTAFFAIWAMPLVLLAGLALAWLFFAVGAYRLVYAGLVVAALPIAIVLLLITVSWVGFALFTI